MTALNVGIVLVGLGIFLLCTCAGISMIIRALAARPRRSAPHETTEPKRDHLAEQLHEIRNAQFGRPLTRSLGVVPPEPPRRIGAAGLHHEPEPKAPQDDYKGPLRRQPNIRRGGKDRRYYVRRRDPELTGRRGTGKEE